MKYLMVDISGKVPKYDIALCEALSSCFAKNAELTLLAANVDPKKIQCKAKRLVSLVPRKFQNSENIVKRSVKAIEGVLNYIYLAFYVFLKKPSVVHLQWLPFLEVSSIESVFIRLMKIVSPKSKYWFTIHNIYPHNSSEKLRKLYKLRFARVEKMFDLFILHLQTSKLEFCKEFEIDVSRCKVIPHGVFEPGNLKIKSHERGEKLRLVMYGNQSFYKGTDILIDAIALLPQKLQQKVSTTIVGKTSEAYLSVLQKKAENVNVSIVPKYLPDNELNEMILESDVIVLPYREISQSGVLLLALYFEKTVLCSDLPSFRETLHSVSKDYFFESGNPKSLALLIENVITGKLNIEDFLYQVRNLKVEYSWKSIAKYYKEVLKW